MKPIVFVSACVGAVLGLCALAILHYETGLHIGDRLVAIALGAGLVGGGVIGSMISTLISIFRIEAAETNNNDWRR